jgi:hypothetical protein
MSERYILTTSTGEQPKPNSLAFAPTAITSSRVSMTGQESGDIPEEASCMH